MWLIGLMAIQILRVYLIVLAAWVALSLVVTLRTASDKDVADILLRAGVAAAVCAVAALWSALHFC